VLHQPGAELGLGLEIALLHRPIFPPAGFGEARGPLQSTAAHAFEGAWAGCFDVAGGLGNAYTLLIKPADDVYVDEPYLSIRWDRVHRHVFSEWRAFANSIELRSSLLKGIQAIRDNHAAAYVSDARKLKVIVHEDQKWIHDKWMPLAQEAGLKRLAFVTAPTGLGKLTIEDVSDLVDHNELQSRTFDSVSSARQWVSEAWANI
jgi:hypothetical protein